MNWQYKKKYQVLDFKSFSVTDFDVLKAGIPRANKSRRWEAYNGRQIQKIDGHGQNNLSTV